MAQREKMQYVLVADDQLFFRSGVRTLLASQIDLRIAGEASTVAEAFSKAEVTSPDVVLMCISLLTDACVEERERVHDWMERSPFVLLTERDDAGTATLLRQLGSAVAIPRFSPASTLVETLRQAASRETDGLNRTADDLNALAKVQSGKSSILTLREQEVVKLLAEGRTVRETAAELFLSIKTIDAHKLNVMRKLDIHNREKLIAYAVSTGIVVSIPA